MREQWERIRATDDPRLMVRYGVQIVRAFEDDEGAGRLLEAVRAAAPTEPEVAEVLAEGMRRHRAGTRGLVDHIERRAGCGAGVTADARWLDLRAVTHPAVWRSLRLEHGWTLDQIEDWMTETLTSQLLAAR